MNDAAAPGTVRSEHRLTPLLEPRSIALVGASARVGTVGHMTVKTLLASGFPGQVHLVNPNYSRIEGRACAGALGDLEEAPDMVIASIGSARIEAALEDAIAAGVRAVTLFDACAGTARNGRPLVDALRERAAEAGLVVCGGNGMGFFNIRGQCHASFYSAAHLQPGGITLIAHSGSVFTVLALNDRRYRFDLVISAGQEIGARIDEYIDYATQRPATRVIALFMETARDPQAFCRALANAREHRIPVVVCKVGRTAESARVARSHSGAMAGDDAAFEAIFERYGALRVATVDQLMNAALLLAQGRDAAAGGLALVTDSGGLREALIDRAEDLGIALARFSDATCARLAPVLPQTTLVSNPLDCAGPLDETFVGVFERALAIVARAPEIGLLGFEFDARDDFLYAPGLQVLAERLPLLTDRPCFVYSSFARAHNRSLGERLASLGVPLLNGQDEMLQAAGVMMRWREVLQLLDEHDMPAAVPAHTVARWRKRLAGSTPLAEADGLTLLRDFGVPVTELVLATSAGEVREAVAALGLPVAIKTAQPGVEHKTDVDGVRLWLRTSEAASAAYAELSGRLGAAVIVQRMAGPGMELAFGCVPDADFGPLVLVASGGVLVESARDKVFLSAPFGPLRARRALQRLRVWPLLCGARGHPVCDIDALSAALSRFSALVAAFADLPLEIDVNPLVVSAAGVRAVDALVVPGGPALRG